MDVLSSTARASQRASRAQKHAGIRIMNAPGRQHAANYEALPLNPHLRLCTLYRRWRKIIENKTPYQAPRRSATTPPLRALSQLGATIHDTVNEISPQTASTLSPNSVSLAPPLPPAYVLGSQQRGGFREAYGDPPRCPVCVTAFQNTADSVVLKHSLLLKDDSY